MPNESRRVALIKALVDQDEPHYKFAASIDINPNDFSRIINGKTDPKPETKQRIANALGRSVEELFGADDQVMAS